jgi:hypothetical protein
MRDDLVDAQASVDWAKAQIPILKQRFVAWERSGPYAVVVEPDPDTRENLVTIRRTRPADLSFNVEAGIIIHAIRSALDLLAAALAIRNGVVPNRNTHFPIFRTIDGFNDETRGIDSAKCKKWLREADRLTIKALKPYGGGDEFLYPFDHLDSMRKHERLVTIVPIIRSFAISKWGGPPGGAPVWEGDHDKAVLFRAPFDVRPRITKSNPTLAFAIVLNEAASLAGKKDTVVALTRYATRVSEIISMFDK